MEWENVAWDCFCKSGDIEEYLLYHELVSQSEMARAEQDTEEKPISG